LLDIHDQLILNLDEVSVKIGGLGGSMS